MSTSEVPKWNTVGTSGIVREAVGDDDGISCAFARMCRGGCELECVIGTRAVIV